MFSSPAGWRARTTLATQLLVGVLLSIVLVAVPLALFVERSVEAAVTDELGDTLLTLLPGLARAPQSPVGRPGRPDGPRPSTLELVRFTDADGAFSPVHPGGATDLPDAEALAEVPVAGPGREAVAVPIVAPGGTRWIAAGLQGPPGQPTTIMAAPTTEVDQTIAALRRRGLMAAGGGLLGMMVLVALVSRAVTRPLGRITDAARQLHEGEHGARVGDLDGPADVVAVGRTFDEMAASIQRSFAAMQAVEERLRRFVADASHELRTPLTAIRGHAELFRLGYAGDDARSARAMRRIEDQSTRMGRLVDDMLLLAELDSELLTGRSPLGPPDPEPADLSAIVHGALDDLHAVQPGRPVTRQVADGVRVDAAAEDMQKVVENVVSNARKHTPETARIDAVLTADSTTARLVFADHGPGLPPGGEERAFERFWRAGGDTAPDADGSTGLGLAITRSLLQRHGGAIRLSSGAEGGVTATIEVPLVADRDVSGSEAAPPTPSARSSHHR
ncbi:MAG TPA: HAMP domain-containing sensor histidine kinase [Euzebya sp.]|nr:HAMP domain-containing sensor histidine kinase [Euzebya sp.]